MKLFIWNKTWKTDYTSGCLVVLAENVEQAREVYRKHIGGTWQDGELAADPEEMSAEWPAVIVDESGGS